ncbi:MAG: hypothetical protein Q4C13_01905 [Clostridia bacterium]|nr:hypothetical protein [Clostridia bacterium]
MPPIRRKDRPLRPFEQYRRSLGDADRALLDAFLAAADEHAALPRRDMAALRADFENALLFYAGTELPLAEALARLDVRHLGGFYLRPPVLWYPLDDAAKIYPLSMKHGRMSVFRLSVYLKEPVVPALLQMALNFTIKRFPSFATTVKKGFFWHYLDACKRRYEIEPEGGLPCQPLRVARSGSQSFRLLHHENRISVEYFHILTDGSGGTVFLKTLAAEYLRLLGHPIPGGEGVLSIDDAPAESETANEFSRADRSRGAAGFLDKAALQLGGRPSRTRPCRVLHFKMDAERLLSAAKARETTITAYLLSRMFVACRCATDEPAGELSIQVPVNMRKFYPSDTLRNFALYCGVRLPIRALGDADGILGEISRQLAEKGSREAMSDMMCATERMVRALRYVPLFIKAPVARLVYGFLGEGVFSNTLSNLGRVAMPEAMAAHVESMDFVLGTAPGNRAGCALITLGSAATLSISKNTADPSFEEKLLELLEADGLDIRVEGSALYAD